MQHFIAAKYCMILKVIQKTGNIVAQSLGAMNNRNTSYLSNKSLGSNLTDDVALKIVLCDIPLPTVASTSCVKSCLM